MLKIQSFRLNVILLILKLFMKAQIFQKITMASKVIWVNFMLVFLIDPFIIICLKH